MRVAGRRSASFPFATGKNVIRLEHNDRFPYFEKLLIAPNPLPEGTPIPKTRDQLAREFDVNPGFLQQWIERLRRSKGAPASVFFGWHAYGTDQSLEDWSSPAAGLFREFKPASREELAGRYADLFRQAVGEWQALYPDSEADFSKNERYKKDEDERKLPDAGLEALRKVVYEKYGPFRPPPDSKQYFPEEAKAEIVRIAKERKTLEDGTPEYPRAMGVTEGEVADIPIHIRGSHWTLADEPQPRGFLRAVSFGEDPAIPNAESGRLQLARWLTGRDHPLTSRVMVNRLWRWHFGRGIVASTDNFGRLGGRPSNQPLLDWLAVQFVESGWSIKNLHRRIMLSHTYQMSTAFDAEAAKIDPENKLLWRMNRRRLEAEAVRDAVMAISGGLDHAMGGVDSQLQRPPIRRQHLREGQHRLRPQPPRRLHPRRAQLALRRVAGIRLRRPLGAERQPKRHRRRTPSALHDERLDCARAHREDGRGAARPGPSR